MDLPSCERPKTTNRKYYPTRQDLRNQVGRAIATSKSSKDDQESLRQKVVEWQTTSTGNFFYRLKPKGKNASASKGTLNEKFLFVHQEVWQQRLLRRYGSDLVLLDATYKTTKYALPLFFVCVHTNVGYKVVAEFICENEDAESISEALAIIKGWNIGWSPSYFMVDYSLAEINAIEKEFPDAHSTESRPGIDGFVMGKMVSIPKSKRSSQVFCNGLLTRVRCLFIILL